MQRPLCKTAWKNNKEKKEKRKIERKNELDA